ncbi:hypothetical protein SAMN05444157_1669 [Frankineae bacterium MT45]|nr:hypothetical protein SAMN05444157_1669 [Frankineae bacterium MT45]
MVPWPTEIARLAEHGYQVLERALAFAPRVAALLDRAEELLARADALVSSIEATDRRAQTVVARAEATVKTTDVVVGEATRLTDQLTPIVAASAPALRRLAPLLAPLADAVTADDVAAVVKLINDLPDIVSKLDRDILPVIDTLGTVAPDLRDLLDVSRDLNEILGALPGVGRAKRRIEEQQDSDDAVREYRAEEEPQPGPNRGGNSNR